MLELKTALLQAARSQFAQRGPQGEDLVGRPAARGWTSPVDLLSWCLMSNHWHLVLRPRRADALAGLMRWVAVTHVRRHHERYHTRGGGHLYQGRFKSFPVQRDGHFLTVCRYVESNPLRAKLVRKAQNWPFGRIAREMPEQS